MPKAPPPARASQRFDPLARSIASSSNVNGTFEAFMASEDSKRAQPLREYLRDLSDPSDEDDDAEAEDGEDAEPEEDDQPDEDEDSVEPEEGSNESVDDSDGSSEDSSTDASSQTDYGDSHGYLFRVRMETVIAPHISRILRVPAAINFADFHRILQVAFGFSNMRSYRFQISSLLKVLPSDWTVLDLVGPGVPIPSYHESLANSDDWRLIDVFEGPRWPRGAQTVYTYDMGSKWEHSIDFLGVADSLLWLNMGMKEKDKVFCVAGAGGPVKEDCGGLDAWEQLKEDFDDQYIPDP